MERPHTGRRRNEAAREAIIDAAITLLQEVGYEGFTIERLASDAGVGKQTVYRWWPSKAAVIAEAVGARAQHTIPLPDTGTLAAICGSSSRPPSASRRTRTWSAS